ncbi:MAG: NADH-quinone oxidoreductase subunit C, partial [Pyrinomonadaceae bacterium]
MSKDIEREKLIEEQSVSVETPGAAQSLAATLQRERADWFGEMTIAFGEITFAVARESLAEICSYLKKTPAFAFDMLADLCGVDRGVEEEPRFEVNYHLCATTKYH